MQCVANPTAAIVAPHVVVAVMIAEGFTIKQLFALINIFSSVEGLKACEWFLIGVVRSKHHHEVVVNGDVCLVARSLLSVRTILSTQRSQRPPTRAQLSGTPLITQTLPEDSIFVSFPEVVSHIS